MPTVGFNQVVIVRPFYMDKSILLFVFLFFFCFLFPLIHFVEHNFILVYDKVFC